MKTTDYPALGDLMSPSRSVIEPEFSVPLLRLLAEASPSRPLANYTPWGYIVSVVSERRVAEGPGLLFTAVQPQHPSHLLQ